MIINVSKPMKCTKPRVSPNDVVIMMYHCGFFKCDTCTMVRGMLMVFQGRRIYGKSLHLSS